MKVLMILFIIILSNGSDAGPLKERLKEHWIKKQKLKPSPALSDQVRSVQFKNQIRYYTVHVPKSYDGKKNVPLFLFLHGGGGSMRLQSSDKFYQTISKSEKAGFIAVFPNGFSKLASGEFATWNAGLCCGDARDEASDDVGFIRKIIQDLTNEFKIDPKKIISAGMSNGAMMSYRLACELTDFISGVGAVAGTDNTVDCKPSKPISILHIHAEDDSHVLFGGGAGKNAFRDKSKINHFLSVNDTIKKWVSLNQCHTTPKRIMEIDGAYCDLYSGCKEDVKVQLCVTKTGGHSWPGGVHPRGKNVTFKGFSATDLILSFHAPAPYP